MIDTAVPDAAPADRDPRLAELRARGAPQADPVGFAFLQALAARTGNHRGAARQLLDAKLTRALADYGRRLTQAAPPATASGEPAGSPLAELLRDLAERPAHGDPSGPPLAASGQLPALKSLAYFRDSWARLSIDQQFTQAMAMAPENAGPLNSHLLILRALQRMRDISPDYLTRFMAYADTLLWLDQATGGSPANARPVVREGGGSPESPRAPRRKTARGKAR